MSMKPKKYGWGNNYAAITLSNPLIDQIVNKCSIIIDKVV